MYLPRELCIMLTTHGSILAAAAMIAATAPALSQTAAAQAYPIKPISLAHLFAVSRTVPCGAR